MRSYYKIFLLVVITGLLASCSTLTVRSTSRPTVNMQAQFNFSMEDLEYVGEVKGTATQSYLLGIPIGGRRKHYGVVGMAGGGLFNLYNKDRAFNNALYDALNSKPDADFILPVSMNVEKHKLFLGSKVTLSVRAKVFKLKEKAPEAGNN